MFVSPTVNIILLFLFLFFFSLIYFVSFFFDIMFYHTLNDQPAPHVERGCHDSIATVSRGSVPGRSENATAKRASTTIGPTPLLLSLQLRRIRKHCAPPPAFHSRLDQRQTVCVVRVCVYFYMNLFLRVPVHSRTLRMWRTSNGNCASILSLERQRKSSGHTARGQTVVEKKSSFESKTRERTDSLSIGHGVLSRLAIAARYRFSVTITIVRHILSQRRRRRR